MEEKSKKLEEFRKKIAIQRKKKFKIFLVIIVVGLLLYGFYFLKGKTLKFLWDLEVFKIKKIEISPENIAPFIKTVLELEKDKNLLFLDAYDLMERVTSISEVEHCKIIKKFPYTLQIEIILRKPWGIIDNQYIIDKNGVIINENRENIPLLQINGVKIDRVGNKIIELEKIYILNEIEMWYNYFNIKNIFKINKIDISDLNKIEINDGERKIYFTKDNIKEKMENLSVILKNSKTDFEYIDTRFKNFYIKFKTQNERENYNRN